MVEIAVAIIGALALIAVPSVPILLRYHYSREGEKTTTLDEVIAILDKLVNTTELQSIDIKTFGESLRHMNNTNIDQTAKLGAMVIDISLIEQSIGNINHSINNFNLGTIDLLKLVQIEGKEVIVNDSDSES